jgi:peptidoglycan/LPS O-acetylase OafA/YrhL
VIWIFVTTTAGRLGAPPAWTAEPVRVVYLAICVWISLKSYRFIEQPMIQLGNRLSHQHRKPSLGAAPPLGGVADVQ